MTDDEDTNYLMAMRSAAESELYSIGKDVRHLQQRLREAKATVRTIKAELREHKERIRDLKQSIAADTSALLTNELKEAIND